MYLHILKRVSECLLPASCMLNNDIIFVKGISAKNCTSSLQVCIFMCEISNDQRPISPVLVVRVSFQQKTLPPMQPKTSG